MINEYDFPSIRPEIPRDRFTRYLLPHPADRDRTTSFTRATTIAGSLDDKYGVHRWQTRLTVQGLKLQPELLDTIDLLEDEARLRDRLQAVADEAFAAAGGSDAADRGTQLHTCTELVDAGVWGLDEVPDEYRREVAAYRAALDKHGIVVPADSIERVLYNPLGEIVGTADRIPVILPDGTRMVGDVKSGKDLSYSWGSISMQLANYADSAAMLEYTDDGTFEWGPAPVVDPDYGLVFHVPVDQGKCTIYLLDLRPGRAALELAHEVREYRRRRGFARPLRAGEYAPAAETAPPAGSPFAPHPDEAAAPSPDPVEAEVYAALDACTTADDMAAVWERFADRWADQYTAYGLARLADTNPAGTAGAK